MRLPDIMELEKFGFYAGFCTSASICTKLTLGHETPMVQIAKSSESVFERTSFELFSKWFNDLWNNNSRAWRA